MSCAENDTPSLSNGSYWNKEYYSLHSLKKEKNDFNFQLGDVIACKIAVFSESDNGLSIDELQAYGIGKSNNALIA